jgi:mono/diheme cytochrome c family protein
MRFNVAAKRGMILLRAGLATEENTMQNKMIWSCRLAVVAIFAAAVLLSPAAKADNAAESTYKAKCAACHGPDGKGETATGKAMKVKDLASEEVQKLSDADLTDAISKGKGKMPPYKTLTPEQVKGLVAYIRSFAKKS